MILTSKAICRQIVTFLIILAVFTMASLPVQANAKDVDPRPPRDTRYRNRTLLRIWIPHISINKGFIETRRIYGEGLTSAIVPKLNGTPGIAGVVKGVMPCGSWNSVVVFYWSPMEFYDKGIKGKAVARGLDIDFSASFGIHPIKQAGQLRPVVMIGISLDYVDIERGATDSLGAITDLTL